MIVGISSVLLAQGWVNRPILRAERYIPALGSDGPDSGPAVIIPARKIPRSETRDPKLITEMIRKLFGLLFLAALLAGAWYYGRQFIERKDIRITVIFDGATGLEVGNHVLEDALVIGEVTNVAKLDTSQDAVSIQIPAKHRDRVRSDSQISLEGDPPGARVVIDNKVSIGSVVEDGAVLQASPRRFAKWLARAREKAAPMVEDLGHRVAEWTRNVDTKKFDEQLDGWAKNVPEWRRQGKDVFDHNLELINDQVDAAERMLRRARRDKDAVELRRRFDAWLEKWSREPEAPPATSKPSAKN